VILPVAKQASQQIGAAKNRAVRRRGTTDDDVVAATGADMPAVDHKFFRPQPGRSRFGIEGGRVRHEFIPIIRRMEIDLHHPGVGRNFKVIQAVIMRRRASFNDNRQLEGRGGLFQRADQFQIRLR